MVLRALIGISGSPGHLDCFRGNRRSLFLAHYRGDSVLVRILGRISHSDDIFYRSYSASLGVSQDMNLSGKEGIERCLNYACPMRWLDP